MKVIVTLGDIITIIVIAVLIILIIGVAVYDFIIKILEKIRKYKK